MAPEHKRLNRYPTLDLSEIKEMPVHLVAAKMHIYIYGFQMLYLKKD